MRPLHVGFRRYYSPRTLRRKKKRTAVIALRIAVIAAMVAVVVVPLEPVAFVWLEASLAVTSTLLAHAQHFKLSLEDIEEYAKTKRVSALTKYQTRGATGALG